MSAVEQAAYYNRRWASILALCAGLASCAGSITVETWVTILLSTVALNTADGSPLSGVWS